MIIGEDFWTKVKEYTESLSHSSDWFLWRCLQLYWCLLIISISGRILNIIGIFNQPAGLINNQMNSTVIKLTQRENALVHSEERVRVVSCLIAVFHPTWTDTKAFIKPWPSKNGKIWGEIINSSQIGDKIPKLCLCFSIVSLWFFCYMKYSRSFH